MTGAAVTYPRSTASRLRRLRKRLGGDLDGARVLRPEAPPQSRVTSAGRAVSAATSPSTSNAHAMPAQSSRAQRNCRLRRKYAAACS